MTPETRVTKAWVIETAGDREASSSGLMDGLATLTGLLLILSILVYTGYLAYTHRSIILTLKTEVYFLLKKKLFSFKKVGFLTKTDYNT